MLACVCVCVCVCVSPYVHRIIILRQTWHDKSKAVELWDRVAGPDGALSMCNVYGIV